MKGNLLTSVLFIILLGLCNSIVAQDRKILKSEYRYANGVINTRIFQYDSMGRLSRMDELGTYGDTIAYDIHSYDGLTDTTICYRAGYFAYSTIITYTDSTYSQKVSWYLLNEDGGIEDSAHYQYDSLGRLAFSQWGDIYSVYMTREYQYLPYIGVMIETYLGTGEKHIAICTYKDKNCTLEKSSRKREIGNLYTSKTYYDKNNRVKRCEQFVDKKLKERIDHQYYDDREVITSLNNNVITIYY